MPRDTTARQKPRELVPRAPQNSSRGRVHRKPLLVAVEAAPADAAPTCCSFVRGATSVHNRAHHGVAALSWSASHPGTSHPRVKNQRGCAQASQNVLRSASGGLVNRAVGDKISHRGGGGARIGHFGAGLAQCWCYVTCGTGGAGAAGWLMLSGQRVHYAGTASAQRERCDRTPSARGSP